MNIRSGIRNGIARFEDLDVPMLRGTQGDFDELFHQWKASDPSLVIKCEIFSFSTRIILVTSSNALDFLLLNYACSVNQV